MRMLCHCKETAFSCTLFKKNGDSIHKCIVYKCDRLGSEVTTKKKKCDFYKEVFLSNDTYHFKEAEVKEYEINVIDHRERINYYIGLCEQFGNSPNYINNIAYLLNILGYKYIHNESIESLKLRLNNPPDKKIHKKINYPINVTMVPDYLRIKNKPRKEKKMKKTIRINDEYYEDSDDDDESVDLDEKDNAFDVDFAESEDEQDDYDSGGYISD